MFSQGKTVVLVKNETARAVSARARIDDDRYRMKKDITRIAEENEYECPLICSPEELEGV